MQMNACNPFREFPETAQLAPHRNGIKDGDFAPVGSVIFNAYWRYVYRVVGYSPTNEVTVEILRNHPYTEERGGRDIWSHRTPVDMRDLILAVGIR
jgi:hypothetical protein